MPRVLVTGATGFIGRHTIPVLERMGYDVVQCTHNQDCDLLDTQKMHRIVERAEASHLLHMAWDVSGDYKNRRETNMRWAKQSMAFIQYFHEHGGKRCVVAGTQRTPEIDATQYGVWKDGLNRWMKFYNATPRISCAYARIYYLFGEGEKPDRLVPYILREHMAGRTPIVSNKALDIMYVSDVASALCYILDSNVQGDVDVGTGILTPIRSLENMARELLILPPVPEEPGAEGYAADPSTLLTTGWKQQYSIQDGLERMIYEMRNES